MDTDRVEAESDSRPTTLRPVAGGLAVTATLIPVVVLVAAAVLWALALPEIVPAQINDFGLVSVLPAAYFAALALVTASFGFALLNRFTPGWLLFSHVALLILIVHGTPSLAYGTLRYAWAWKHVGMVDYVQRHASVDPGIVSLADLGANHSWPGFFALGTLFTEAGGFASALGFAALAPIFFNLLNIGALLLLFGRLVRDRRLKWLAIWLFFLANWIGQDYFAPQALAYFFSLVIVGLGLTWFASGPQLRAGGSSRGLGHRLEAFWGRVAGTTPRDVRLDWPAWPGQRLGVMAIIVLLAIVVTTTHQLTPFIVFLSLAGLVIAYQISARSLPVLMAVLIATWMLYVAWFFVRGNLFWIIESFGNLDRNATVTDLSRLSLGQVVVALAARGLTLLIGLLGLAGLVRRWRRGRRDIAFVLLALAPFPMLVASSYSGEMPFRVYFFALPYVAFFAAALFFPAPSLGSSWRTSLAVVGVSGLLLTGLLFAYYGRERMNYFTPGEVAAANYLYDNAPAGSLVVSVTYNYPSLFKDYERFEQRTLTGQATTRNQLIRLEDDPQTFVTRVMSDTAFPATYLILTRSQQAHAEMDNVLPQRGWEPLVQAIEQSGAFETVYQNQDARILALSKPGGQGR